MPRHERKCFAKWTTHSTRRCPFPSSTSTACRCTGCVCVRVGRAGGVAGSRNYHVVRGRWTLPPGTLPLRHCASGPKPRPKLKLKPKRVFRATTTKLMYSASTHTHAHTHSCLHLHLGPVALWPVGVVGAGEAGSLWRALCFNGLARCAIIKCAASYY